MWSEYFMVAGFLLAVYLVARWVVMDTWRLPPGPPHRPIEYDGKGIDARVLSERLGQVRGSWAESKAPTRFPAIKRTVMVESKREEMRKMAFFQTPAPHTSEPPPTDHGLLLLLG